LHQHLEFMPLQPGLAGGYVAVARCLVKLGRMKEINAALQAAIEPTSGPSVVGRANGRGGPDQRTGRVHAAPL